MNQTRKPNKNASCPICNKAIFKNDIIPLFVSEVYALETNELDIFVDRLNTTKKERDVIFFIYSSQLFFMVRFLIFSYFFSDFKERKSRFT